MKRIQSDLPRPYNLDSEIHKACRDGNISQISKLISSHPSLVDVRDGKVFKT